MVISCGHCMMVCSLTSGWLRGRRTRAHGWVERCVSLASPKGRFRFGGQPVLRRGICRPLSPHAHPKRFLTLYSEMAIWARCVSGWAPTQCPALILPTSALVEDQGWCFTKKRPLLLPNATSVVVGQGVAKRRCEKAARLRTSQEGGIRPRLVLEKREGGNPAQKPISCQLLQKKRKSQSSPG